MNQEVITGLLPSCAERKTDVANVRSAAAAHAAPILDDWPVDVQRMDASGEVDLGQLEFNLSLTPAQRLEQNDTWIEFIHIARCAGRQFYARKPPP